MVAGGIAPRIIDAMSAGGFMTAFKDKGRLSPLMDTIPVQVALNPKAPSWAPPSRLPAGFVGSPGTRRVPSYVVAST